MPKCGHLKIRRGAAAIVNPTTDVDFLAEDKVRPVIHPETVNRCGF